jgi:hypothetical protein
VKENKIAKLYHMNVSDALVIAPMGLYYPQLFEPITPDPQRYPAVSIDVFNEDFLFEVFCCAMICIDVIDFWKAKRRLL